MQVNIAIWHVIAIDCSLIMGQMGQRKIMEGIEKISTRRGLPKLFCLIREALKKRKLVFVFISSDYP